MKKSIKKIIAVILSIVTLFSCTSMMSFAADDEPVEEITNSLGDWANALLNYDLSDFYEFISAILAVFGFKGDFEGVHSLPELMNEWFEMLGPIGDFYENFINSIGTSDLLELLMGLLA